MLLFLCLSMHFALLPVGSIWSLALLLGFLPGRECNGDGQLERRRSKMQLAATASCSCYFFSAFPCILLCCQLDLFDLWPSSLVFFPNFPSDVLWKNWNQAVGNLDFSQLLHLLKKLRKGESQIENSLLQQTGERWKIYCCLNLLQINFHGARGNPTPSAPHQLWVFCCQQ